MTTAISILTCRRPGVSYVEATAAALMQAGGVDCDACLVIVDGERAPHLPGWDVQPGPHLGAAGAAWRVFRAALATGADRLIFCEDDIIPCRNAVRWMAEFEIPPDIAFVDFYDLALRFAVRPALYRMPPNGLDGSGYHGTQCMVFPRRTLEWLVRQDPFAGFALPNGDALPPGPHGHTDTAIGCLLTRSLRPRYLIHLPRLVRHVGAVSAAYPARAALPDVAYPGDDFDALSLRLKSP